MTASTPVTGPREKPDVTQTPRIPPGTEQRPVTPPAEPKEVSKEWEDQRIKLAARQLAAQSTGIKKGKICYSVKGDEWWVVLYQDGAEAYEVKQFIWNRDQERLEPFLVVTRIAKNRLDDHLNGSEPNRTCEILDLGQ